MADRLIKLLIGITSICAIGCSESSSDRDYSVDFSVNLFSDKCDTCCMVKDFDLLNLYLNSEYDSIIKNYAPMDDFSTGIIALSYASIDSVAKAYEMLNDVMEKCVFAYDDGQLRVVNFNETIYNTPYKIYAFSSVYIYVYFDNLNYTTTGVFYDLYNKSCKDEMSLIHQLCRRFPIPYAREYNYFKPSIDSLQEIYPRFQHLDFLRFYFLRKDQQFDQEYEEVLKKMYHSGFLKTTMKKMLQEYYTEINPNEDSLSLYAKILCD